MKRIHVNGDAVDILSVVTRNKITAGCAGMENPCRFGFFLLKVPKELRTKHPPTTIKHLRFTENTSVKTAPNARWELTAQRTVATALLASEENSVKIVSPKQTIPFRISAVTRHERLSECSGVRKCWKERYRRHHVDDGCRSRRPIKNAVCKGCVCYLLVLCSLFSRAVDCRQLAKRNVPTPCSRWCGETSCCGPVREKRRRLLLVCPNGSTRRVVVRVIRKCDCKETKQCLSGETAVAEVTGSTKNRKKSRPRAEVYLNDEQSQLGPSWGRRRARARAWRRRRGRARRRRLL